ncbi:cytochrome c3 family protein [Candidatus Halobeggiatoa sp. HSG11]|nr:cytochrome c3 family protein [Candidatus Halobeggiatoa sp. HSG11]
MFIWLPIAEAVPLIATSQKPLQANFNQPTAIAISDNGQAYVLDGVNGMVKVFNSQGKFKFKFGKTGNKVGELKLPMDIHIAKQQIYIADTGNHRISIFDLKGKFKQNVTLDKTAEPVGLIVQDNYIIWSDRNQHQLCRTNVSNQSTCWETKGKNSKFNFPFMLAKDSDNYLYIVDILNAKVKIFNQKGYAFGDIANFGLQAGELVRPNGISIDKQDVIYISDSYQGTISIFKNRKFQGLLQDADGKLWHFQTPVGIKRWQDKLYVVDAGKNQVEVLQLQDGKPTISIKKSPSSSKNCVTCHLSWSENFVAVKKSLPVVEPKMCYSCHHGAIIDSRNTIGHGSQHPNLHIKSQNEDTAKIPADFPLKKEELYCGSCHTPHNKNTKETGLHADHNNSWLRIGNEKEDLCHKCHEAYVETQNHPLGIILKRPTDNGKNYTKQKNLQHGLPNSLLKQGSRLGKEDELVCASCHRVHGGKIDTPLLAQTAQKLCKTCHANYHSKNKKAAHKKGIHPVDIKLEKPVKVGDKKVKQVTCDTCHDVHDSQINTASLIKQVKNQAALCKTCHADYYSKNKKAAHKKGIHPVDIKLEKPVKIGDKKIKQVTCDTCHSVHNGQVNTASLTKQVKNKAKLCKTCHADYYSKGKKSAHKKGIHPVDIKLEKPVKIGEKKIKQVTCDTCHSVHNGQVNTASLRIKDEVKLCKTCHDRQHADNSKDAKEKNIHPVNITLDKAITIGKKSTKKITCKTCHSMHQGKTNTPALVQQHTDGQLCDSCHADKTQVIDTKHDLRNSAPDSHNLQKESPKTAGLCGSCHSLHTADNLFLNNAAKIQQADDILERDKLCLACHNDESIAKDTAIKEFSHPYQDLILRSNSEILPLLDRHEKINEFGRIACITCHNPHKWQPGKQQNKTQKEGNILNSFLHRKGVKGTFCVDCHGLEARLKYKYYHDKNSRPQLNLEIR